MLFITIVSHRGVKCLADPSVQLALLLHTPQRTIRLSQPLVSQLLTWTVVILHISSLCLPASAICPLECIQNASAWLVFNLWNSHVTPLLPANTTPFLTFTLLPMAWRPLPSIRHLNFAPAQPLLSSKSARLAPSSLHMKGYCLSRSRHFSICWSLHWWNKLPKLSKQQIFQHKATSLEHRNTSFRVIYSYIYTHLT